MGGEPEVIPGAGAPDEHSGDRHPVISRVWAKVNRPPPVAKTFGTGEPAFEKRTGRSPGAPPPLVDSGRRRSVGDLPEIEIGQLPELRKRRSRLDALKARLARATRLERLIAAGLVFALFLVVVIARRR